MVQLTAAVTLQVQAPLAIVWDVIQDFESLPEYNPTYLSIERIGKEGGETNDHADPIQLNDKFRAVRQGGKVDIKVVSAISSTPNDDECSISFVESCTSTYTLTLKAIDSKSCFLIGSFGASPNRAITRFMISLCSPCFRKLAAKEFARLELEPVRIEAEARLRGQKRQQQV